MINVIKQKFLNAGEVVSLSIPHAIMFHHFHDCKKHPVGQSSITAHELYMMLEAYSHTHNLLSAWDWYEKAISNKLSPNDVCLTFDDNLRCQFDIALPVLESFNIKAFWFIYTSPLDNVPEKLEVYRYFRSTAFENIDAFYHAFEQAIEQTGMKEVVQAGRNEFPDTYLADSSFYSREDKVFRYVRDQILNIEQYNQIMQSMMSDMGMNIHSLKDTLWMDRACILSLKAKGHVIGLHSHSHPMVMNQLSYPQQQAEYRINYSKVRELIEQDVVSMSHPCNSYSEDTLHILRELGIRIGFRAIMNPKEHSLLEFPRMDHAYLMKTN